MPPAAVALQRSSNITSRNDLLLEGIMGAGQRPERPMGILDHIDLRVRDRNAAVAFYDAFLGVLGAQKSETEAFTTWRLQADVDDESTDSFGITEDPDMVAGSVRIAFKAPTREAVDAIAAILRNVGASDIEMDDGMYGDDIYAVFFKDPDGNRLEVTVNE